MSEAKLIVVYGNRGEGTVEFIRSDTGKPTSCVDCSAFDDERGLCIMKYAHPWPIGRVACSQWSLRTEPIRNKQCKACSREYPLYIKAEFCSGMCEDLHGLYKQSAMREAE